MSTLIILSFSSAQLFVLGQMLVEKGEGMIPVLSNLRRHILGGYAGIRTGSLPLSSNISSNSYLTKEANLFYKYYDCSDRKQ